MKLDQSLDDIIAGNNTGGGGGGGGGGAPAAACYGCGGTGHFKRECPSAPRGGGGGGGRRTYGRLNMEAEGGGGESGERRFDFWNEWPNADDAADDGEEKKRMGG